MKKKKGGKKLIIFFLVILAIFALICGALFLLVDKLFATGVSLNGEWKAFNVTATIDVENKEFSLTDANGTYSGTITALKFDKKKFIHDAVEDYVATIKSDKDTYQCTMNLDTSGDNITVELKSDRWGGTTYTLTQISDSVGSK